MDTKVCNRCGRAQLVDQFRPLYYGKKGTYGYCRTCERIEQRRKYLANKSCRGAEEQLELDKINELYDLYKAHGLKVPVRRRGGVTAVVDALLAEQTEQTEQMELPVDNA